MNPTHIFKNKDVSWASSKIKKRTILFVKKQETLYKISEHAPAGIILCTYLWMMPALQPSSHPSRPTLDCLYSDKRTLAPPLFIYGVYILFFLRYLGR
jgi:hypothetical protein